MKLTDNERRDVIKYLESGKPLPDKYRFLLFDDDREVELTWNGKTNEVTNIVLPFQTIEHIDEPRSEVRAQMQQSLFDTSGRQIKGWTNKLIWGDNKLILSSLKNGPLRKEIEAQGGIKLIYIDPPFDVGADFSMNVEIGDEEFTKKPSIIEEVAYRDTWGKGADSFIAMIYERLLLMSDLLTTSGSIYVHCDYRVNTYMRLVLDEVFGRSNFINEIIWHYKTFQGQTHRYFARKHDTILLYSKSDSFKFHESFATEFEDTIDSKRWSAFLNDKGQIVGAKMPTQDSRFVRYLNKWIKSNKRQPDAEDVIYEVRGQPIDSVWEMKGLDPKSGEKVGYPTQKPEDLLERIITTSSDENDLIADFFVGSGSTLAVAEKLGRKWIGTDLGRFSIHTARKRMIGVQRELKKAGKDFRPFEILNLGKYEREHYVATNENLRKEERNLQQELKEAEFVKLILAAYKAEAVNSFQTIVGKKRDRLVAVGPINFPVSSDFLHQVISECIEKNITKVDVLGFDWEMGMDLDQFKSQGIDVQLRVIPREVFDKRAVEKGQVKFYEVAFIEVKPLVKKNTISVELLDFSVFYNQDDTGEIEEKLKPGGSKVVVENGQVIKLSKAKGSEIINREVLTTKWTDWVDYWAVDFNFESKKEFIRTVNPTSGQDEESWTGNYIFENEWQSFRTRQDRSLELKSASYEVSPGVRKIAIKVVDIFGNDTTKVIEVKI